MVQVTLEQANKQFAKLLEEVDKGEQVLIMRDDAPPAILSSAIPTTGTPLSGLPFRDLKPVKKPRQFGAGKGEVLFIADDFDAPLEDFAEYM
jgi:antitoxin (DNA-binding transcriptional repressor) of toxin-antitoxin stability system